MNISIKDIAAKMGVAPSTVSRALNGMHGVSSKTRESVLRVAQEMGYVRNAAAKSLVEKRSHLVGIVVPETEPSRRAPLFELFPSINRTLDLHGKSTVVNFFGRTSYPAGELEKLCRARNLDGVIIMPGFGVNHSIYQDAKTLDRPVVVLSENVVGKRCSSVGTDEILGASLPVCHLVELGHGRIGFINGPETISICKARLAGYKKGLSDTGLVFDENWVVHSDFSGEGGAKSVFDLLNRHPNLTAIVFANDLMALGGLQMLQRLNISVPQQISITGYDDAFYTHLLTPALTTVRHSSRIGIRAAELLIMLMAGGTGRIEVLTPELMIRESTQVNLA